MLPITSLDTATGAGAGAVYDLQGVGRLFTMMTTVTGATPSYLTVSLDGSHNGEDWISLGGSSSLHPDIVSVSTHLVRYVRASITRIDQAAGAAVTATIAAVGGEDED